MNDVIYPQSLPLVKNKPCDRCCSFIINIIYNIYKFKLLLGTNRLVDCSINLNSFNNWLILIWSLLLYFPTYVFIPLVLGIEPGTFWLQAHFCNLNVTSAPVQLADIIDNSFDNGVGSLSENAVSIEWFGAFLCFISLWTEYLLSFGLFLWQKKNNFETSSLVSGDFETFFTPFWRFIH